MLRSARLVMPCFSNLILLKICWLFYNINWTFEVLTIFWDVTPCNLVHIHIHTFRSKLLSPFSGRKIQQLRIIVFFFSGSPSGSFRFVKRKVFQDLVMDMTTFWHPCRMHKGLCNVFIILRVCVCVIVKGTKLLLLLWRTRFDESSPPQRFAMGPTDAGWWLQTKFFPCGLTVAHSSAPVGCMFSVPSKCPFLLTVLLRLSSVLLLNRLSTSMNVRDTELG